MLLDSFQKLSEKERKKIYEEIQKIIDSPMISLYPDLKKEINEGNEHKVGVIRSLINTKMSTTLTWEGCLAAVSNNF
jgi:hypothetical protein